MTAHDDSRYMSEMVAGDTIVALTARVRTLVESGRKMTLSTRWIHPNSMVIKTAWGLTLEQPVIVARSDGRDAVTVHLSHLNRFGFAVHPGDVETAAEAWERYRTGPRRNMTSMEIHGGQSDATPSINDRVVIRHWDNHGICDEVAVGFSDGLVPETAWLLPIAARASAPALEWSAPKLEGDPCGVLGPYGYADRWARYDQSVGGAK